eukprot:TRINITY_DN25677_c0_g2_i1.p1 TRINITY_DN25677_c0_g2~~TRINITY_DN25677_c0_g2_i1.p1  ORF type:complete len:400 (+),score=85.76 TRINITY_DN25677_c0_g2_i1:612-1811(+)
MQSDADGASAETDYAVCLDFGRPTVWLVPLLSFAASLVKGLSGMGEALVFACLWQLAHLAGVGETEDFGLLAALISIQQCQSTLALAIINAPSWARYKCHGLIFAFFMLVLSPSGNHAREELPSVLIRELLAVLFLSFALLKVVADTVQAMRQCGDDAACADEEKGNSQPIVVGIAEETIAEPSAIIIGAKEEAEASFATLQGAGGSADVAVQATHADELETSSLKAADVNYPLEPTWLKWALPVVGCSGGFLGGLCGMNGPPFILLVAFTGLEKDIARNIFPMGQTLEVWFFRLPALIWLRRILARDLHLHFLCVVAGQFGLQLGNKLSKHLSQKMFERAMLTFLMASSLLVLGLLELRAGAAVATAITGGTLVMRCLCPIVCRAALCRRRSREAGQL